MQDFVPIFFPPKLFCAVELLRGPERNLGSFGSLWACLIVYRGTSESVFIASNAGSGGQKFSMTLKKSGGGSSLAVNFVKNPMIGVKPANFEEKRV